jgi:hypothetical protein
MALPFTYITKYIKAKRRRIMETQKYFNMQKNKYNIHKRNPSQTNQNPSRYYYNNSITNLKFQHKPKYIIVKKSSYKNK